MQRGIDEARKRRQPWSSESSDERRDQDLAVESEVGQMNEYSKGSAVGSEPAALCTRAELPVQADQSVQDLGAAAAAPVRETGVSQTPPGIESSRRRSTRPRMRKKMRPQSFEDDYKLQRERRRSREAKKRECELERQRRHEEQLLRDHNQEQWPQQWPQPQLDWQETSPWLEACSSDINLLNYPPSMIMGQLNEPCLPSVSQPNHYDLEDLSQLNRHIVGAPSHQTHWDTEEILQMVADQPSRGPSRLPQSQPIVHSSVENPDMISFDPDLFI